MLQLKKSIFEKQEQYQTIADINKSKLKYNQGSLL